MFFSLEFGIINIINIFINNTVIYVTGAFAWRRNLSVFFELCRGHEKEQVVSSSPFQTSLLDII